MKIKKFILNPFQLNCYLYFDEASKKGIIIDPGAYDESEENIILNFINSNNIKIEYIINTHGHIDHILGNAFAKECFGVPLMMNSEDIFLLNNAPSQSAMFGLKNISSPNPDLNISDETILYLSDTKIMFLHTPGHSPGGICIIDHLNKNVFCGDLIFANSIGRTDLPGGDMDILLDSIYNKLFKECSDDYILYPGHMEETAILNEKKYNPFLQ